MRSVLRWLRRLMTGVLLFTAIVIAVALVVAHTACGREQLRTRVEAALQEAFPGGARVRAVEGNILGTLTVRDIELDGRDRTPLVTIGKLDAEVALWPLVVQTARIDALVAEDVHVFVHGQPPPASPPGYASQPSLWQVELPHVEIHRASVEIEAGGSKQTFAGLDVTGAATITPASGTTIFGWAHGQWSRTGATPAPAVEPAPTAEPAPAAELTATAAVVLDGSVHVPAALITLGGMTPSTSEGDSPRGALTAITATDLVIDTDHPSGKILVSAPARAVATLIPELGHAGIAPGRLGDVSATIDITAATPATTRVAVNATAGEATLWASLEGDLTAETAHGKLSAHAVDLALVTRGRVAGRADLFAKGHREGNTVALDDGSWIIANASEVVLADQRVTGTLAVNATATGTLQPALAVNISGKAEGDKVVVKQREPGGDVAATGVEIATVQGPFQLHVGTGTPLGKAHLTATEIRNAGTPLGSAHADIENHADGPFRIAASAWPPTKGLEISADALVTLGETGKPTVATLDRAHVTLPNGMSWTGRGGSVVLTDATVALRDVTLHNGDATVALRGDYLRSSGALVAHADGDRFMAAAIDPRYRGFGRGTLELTRRGGVWNAEGTFALSGFAAAAEATPIDGNAHVVLASQRLTLDASATGPALGRFGLAFEAVAPRDPFDLRAWRALDRNAVRNAKITADEVALSGAVGLAGPLDSRAQLTGTIRGTVNLAPAELRGELALHGVELPFGAIDGNLTFAPHEGDLEARGGLTFKPREADPEGSAAEPLSRVVAADLMARLAVPEHPFDPASWQRRGRDFLKQAEAKLDDVSVPDLLSRLGVARRLTEHGVVAPSAGRVTAKLELGAAATEAQLTIDVNDVTGGALVAPVSSHMAISAGAHGTQLRATLSGSAPGHNPGHDIGLGVIDAYAPMTIDRWLSEPAAALRAPLTADWALVVTQIKPLLAIVGRDELAGGSLEGRAAIRGTLGTPIIPSVRLLARDLAFAPRRGGHPLPVLRDLDVTGTWGGASGTLEITGHQATGGELHAFANGRPDALADVTGWLTANRLDIAPIAVMWPRPLVPTAGVVDVKLRVRAGGRIAGKLHVIDGALPISAALGTLHGATSDLVIHEAGAIAGTIDGKLGRGALHLEANVAADGTTMVKALQLRDVSVRSAFDPVITADLTAKLHLEGGQLRGEATVKQARITLPEHAGTALLDASAPPDLQFIGPAGAVAAPEPQVPKPQVSEPQVRAPRGSHPWLDVAVTLGPTQIDAPNVVDSVGLAIHATLHSRDPLEISIGDTVSVSGNIELHDAHSAYVDFLGRRYVVDPTSNLKFDNTIDPELDIRMTHQFPALILSVGLFGRASQWQKPQLSGDPGGYSYDQLFGFLLGGEPGGDPNSQTREAVKGAAVLAISGKLGREINKVLPIKVDALSCEPSPTATIASCTGGKWLSQRLFLAYRLHLEALPDENVNDVQLQYRLWRKVLIEGTGGDRGHYGADLLWRHRW